MKISMTEIGEGVRIATQTLKSNRLRSVLTTLGILIGVVVNNGIVMVCRKGASQRVKDVVQRLKDDDRQDLL